MAPLSDGLPREADPVSLDNCADEPIHVPGSIQPHGALLAFDGAGGLIAWSDNARALLGIAPASGRAYRDLVPAEVAELLDGLPASSGDGDDADPMVASAECVVEGRLFDVVVHVGRQARIAEFEARAQGNEHLSDFALKAHRAIERLRRHRTVDELMQAAATHLREITGFDRVMGYRFRHDDSGDVIAESCDPALEPYLGRRYPASDIPAQARRLYLINTLRVIVDLGYRPVPIVGAPGAAAIDMSHCVLRSVSPIHVEYLPNMGVGASMSVSIVVGGRLWGLLACHHRTPHHVPFSLRMACDVMAQVLGSTVQSLAERRRAALAESAVGLRTGLIEALHADDEMLRAVDGRADAIRGLFGADAMVTTEFEQMLPVGLSEEVAGAVVRSLTEETGDIVHRYRRDMWPEPARSRIGRWVGLLALRADPATNVWIALLRPEQVTTVRWGGRPEKEFRVGPLGPRLTPRGSFEEWREEVRDSAEPWDDNEIGLAQHLIDEIRRASDRRRSDLERARLQMLAMLGHDLRDPLTSISMAAQVLEYRQEDSERLGRRIQASSNRMARLISQVLDMARLESGSALDLSRHPTEVRQLLADLIDELKIAYPATHLQLDAPATVQASIDPDRLTQAVSNLLSNARHHGDPKAAIGVRVRALDSRLLIDVSNVAAPIPESRTQDLFSAFKRGSINPRNRSGLGLGLYIARRIALEHGGDLRYQYQAPRVVFTIELPRYSATPDAAAVSAG